MAAPRPLVIGTGKPGTDGTSLCCRGAALWTPPVQFRGSASEVKAGVHRRGGWGYMVGCPSRLTICYQPRCSWHTSECQGSDEDDILAVVGENPRRPEASAGSRPKVALGGPGGLTGSPTPGTGIRWTTTIKLGSRPEIVQFSNTAKCTLRRSRRFKTGCVRQYRRARATRRSRLRALPLRTRWSTYTVIVQQRGRSVRDLLGPGAGRVGASRDDPTT